MKRMKKAFALMLAAVMVMAMAVTSFATEETGSITINGVSESTTYSIYKLLDLESYDVVSGAYSYKVNSAWTAFFATEDAKTYISVGTDGYVAWNTTEDNDTVATFAKLALAYAKTNGILPVQSSTTEGQFAITGTTGKFSNLSLGYYLIDSTMGALCGLTTTNPNASINAKNGVPTIEKQVLEDSTSQWGTSNTADIGQTVEYFVTINVHAGAENYVLHDTMEPGLTFKEVTKVEHVIPDVETHTAPAEKYQVKTGDAVTDGCDFEVHFSKEFCDDLESNNKVIIYYTAMLNRFAEITVNQNDDTHENTNTAWLTFGEGGKSNEASVATKTFGIDLVKTDSQNSLIDGAGFKIYTAETGGYEIAVVPLMEADDVTPILDSNGNPMYRRARTDEIGVEVMVKDGIVRINGFDNGTYYLEETTTPAGYNKITTRQKFIISDGSLNAVFNPDPQDSSKTIYSTGSGVHVVNKTGSMLPETGGMGTVMFVTCGSIVVMAAGVLLVTKKRMSMIQD